MRRGGEQLEVDLRSQTHVNTIQPIDSASLLATGEACSERSDRDESDRSSKIKSRESKGGWCENAGKVTCGSDETCVSQEPEDREHTGVRAAIVALKPGNSGGAKGGRKVNSSSEGKREAPPPAVPERDKQGGEDLWQRHKAERGVWSEKMLTALETGVKGNKWFSLIDKITKIWTLELAWAKVRVNAGACGVDGITVARFAKDSQTRLLAVKEHIENRSYQPKPVKREWISKPGSKEKRPLGIPTVTDRVVQAATKMVIEPIFERDFAPQSFGFRPGRSCKDALRRVEGLLNKGHQHVVDIDIKGYFDAIPHERLMSKVSEKIADSRVLGLIESFLKAGVMDELQERTSESGTPQGGVISPLLANIYLNDLDWQLANEGYELTRYADDIVIQCKSAEEAQRALELVQGWMDGASLTLHPEKTKIVDMRERGASFDFLGYRFRRNTRGRINRLVRPKSEKKLREGLKPLTKRANGRSMEAIVAQINPKLKGWFGYFKHANIYQLSSFDSWIRQRLRAIQRKRRGGRGRGRGKDHYRWPNSYFANLGLFSLKEAKEQARQSP
jgi:RNA-directed DNA polymerase